MNILTHEKINRDLCGSPLAVENGYSRVELKSMPHHKGELSLPGNCDKLLSLPAVQRKGFLDQNVQAVLQTVSGD